MVNRQWVLNTHDWDQNKFIKLNKKGGIVAFGDDSFVKILGKGAVNIGSENVKY
jgi:hypothetical protein